MSVATLFDKISRDEDTLSDWLGASSDIALIIAGYTGNPIIAGTATVLGIASILTSDLAVGMAKGYLNAVQKYGLVDPDTGGWLLPPGYINEPSLGPDMSIPETTTSPVILDLDGDGIETRSLQDGIFFDHDGNHFAENTGWVSADDGLLVIDKDGNGKIDSGNELFGNMTDLHVAMSLNPELQAMVEQYIVDPLNSQALLQDIIFTWAGVADIAADSRGENIDARRLSVLEKATGENYQNKVNGTTDPLKNAAVLLEDEYKRFSDFIEASLLSQTLYRDDFATISLTMKSDYSGLTLNFDDFASHLESIKLTDVNEYLHLRKTFYSLFEYSPSYSDVREQLGIPSEQLFFGDDGNDTLSGNKTNDYIWGSTGNDTLKGGYGSDTYFFSAGGGKDSLYEGSSNAGDVDTLRFGEGIRPEDVILQRKITNGLSANDRLVISFRDSTDSITIDNFFTAERYQVEHITFADGTDWLPEDILNYLEDDIPLPIAAPPDTPVSMSLLRQEMAAFSGGEYDNDTGVVVNTTLVTARTTVNSLVSY
ncbi:calcium-binding protein [Kluyvera ascorbata]|uniref:calcium-binding protein n=1 Tax=Kluyvera ascorbata TaxID=51288 RepID=UPI003563CABA